MAERLEIDVSQALADIAKLKGGIADLKTQIGQTGKAAEQAFDEGFAVGMVDALNELQKEYGQIKQSADVLKNALKSATDPQLIKLYAQNIAKLEAGMKRLETTGKAAGVNLKEVNKSAGTGQQVFENYFGAFTKVTLIIAAIDAVVTFTKYAVGLSENINQAKKSFEAFTGSAAQADKIVNQLIATGEKNFIPTDDILQAGKALLLAGESADSLPDVLGRIADVSAATGKDINELTKIYGSARTAGVLYAEDINQLVDAGIPIIQEFAKQMGVSNDQVKKLASEGKISFEELQLAMFNLTAEGGKFANQAQVQADSISGAWNRAVSVVQPAIQAIGDVAASFFKDVLDGFTITATAIGNLFSKENTPKIEVDYTGRDAYEQNKEDIYDRDQLEKQAEEKRRERAKKTSAELAKIEKERSKLRIEAMVDGQAKEVAAEELRYKELVTQLKKYHIDTAEATEQHNKNLQSIELKYTLQRIADEQALLDLRKEQALYEAEQAGADVEKKKKALEELKALRESEVDITASEFDNLIKTLEAGGVKKEEIAKLQLEFDKRIQGERLQAEIDFQKGLLGVTDAGDKAAIELIKNKIALLQNQLDGLDIPGPSDNPGDNKGILGLLGIDLELNDEQFAALGKGFDDLKSIISDFSAAQVEAADAAVESAQKQIQAAQSVVDEQKRLSELGFANNLTDAQKNLEAAKAAEAKALEQRKKAAKQQAALDTAAQVSSLITASAQTLKTFNGPLLPVGIALIALMFGAFFAAKARAAQAAKFRDGGSGRVDGNSIIVGASHDTGGVGIEAEGGEFFGTDGKRFGIVNKRMTAKHFDLLSAINRDDKGKMREALAKLAPSMDRGAALGAIGEGAGSVVVMGRNGTDAKAREYLKDIRDNGRTQTTIEGNYSVQRKGNHTRKTRMK